MFMKNKVVEETIIEINGTDYIVRTITPSKTDIKVIKGKVKKIILNNLDNTIKVSN